VILILNSTIPGSDLKQQLYYQHIFFIFKNYHTLFGQGLLSLLGLSDESVEDSRAFSYFIHWLV